MTRPAPKELNHAYVNSLDGLNFAALKSDITSMLKTSQSFWPADFGHYGPLFVRLAWHCAGSYRRSDGMGGCDGARIRFDHENSWADNANLDKAKKLLWSVKKKWGDKISWGDLIVLTADTAMEDMGFETLGTCLGRLDDDSGFWSEELGPSDQQQEVAPCPEGSGKCQEPFGAAFLQHIYVNPGGREGNSSDLVGSALQIREVFGRMGMNDSETIALIGGGHAFGKAHGRCAGGPGPSPVEQPWDSWPGTCGSGKGADATTSKFEGAWTETPIVWSNLYFKYLRDLSFVKSVSPAGNTQWEISPDPATKSAPVAHGSGKTPIMMLTSDVALLHDDSFKQLVHNFADDWALLNNSFAHAWYKLMTRDLGPYERCVGPLKPGPQPWQHVVPSTSPSADSITEATTQLQSWLSTQGARDSAIWLAAQCAATFRVTDYRGGCNGARIRFSGEKGLAINMRGTTNKLDAPLKKIQTIKDSLSGSLSMSDLIVLAGGLAVMSSSSGIDIPFCGGRGDASSGEGSANLYPWLTMNGMTGAVFKQNDLQFFLHAAKISGLTTPEVVAFMARMHLADWRSYYLNLLNNDWVPVTTDDPAVAYRAQDGVASASQADLFLTYDDDMKAVAQQFATGTDDLFKQTFKAAWNKLMSADRFNGPVSNVCADHFATDAPSPSPPSAVSPPVHPSPLCIKIVPP